MQDVALLLRRVMSRLHNSRGRMLLEDKQVGETSAVLTKLVLRARVQLLCNWSATWTTVGQKAIAILRWLSKSGNGCLTRQGSAGAFHLFGYDARRTDMKMQVKAPRATILVWCPRCYAATGLDCEHSPGSCLQNYLHHHTVHAINMNQASTPSYSLCHKLLSSHAQMGSEDLSIGDLALFVQSK